jgi:hypothetical protein
MLLVLGLLTDKQFPQNYTPYLAGVAYLPEHGGIPASLGRCAPDRSGSLEERPLALNSTPFLKFR